jgi:hypothetical protein
MNALFIISALVSFVLAAPSDPFVARIGFPCSAAGACDQGVPFSFAPSTCGCVLPYANTNASLTCTDDNSLLNKGKYGLCEPRTRCNSVGKCVPNTSMIVVHVTAKWGERCSGTGYEYQCERTSKCNKNAAGDGFCVAYSFGL